MTSEWYPLKGDELCITFFSRTPIDAKALYLRFRGKRDSTDSGSTYRGRSMRSLSLISVHFIHKLTLFKLYQATQYQTHRSRVIHPLLMASKNIIYSYILWVKSVSIVCCPSQSLTFVMSDWHEFLIQICPIDWQSFKTDPVHTKIFSIFKVSIASLKHWMVGQ